MSYDRNPIRVNRILTRKPGIAGIPQDVFISTIFVDLLLYLLLVQMLHLSWDLVALITLVIDGTWILLTLRGVWRLVGLAIKPTSYVRSNAKYNPRLPIADRHGYYSNQASKTSSFARAN